MFREANQQKLPWDKRAQLIQERFPSSRDLNWKAAFDRDLNLFGRIMRDILKLDQAAPGRPGPRPSLDQTQATKRLRQFMGQDYSILPFAEAFRILAGERSIRQLARKVDLTKTQVHRLLRNEMEPDAYVMEQVAKAFDKRPSYFLEYRTLVIANALLDRMAYAPESTIGIYRKLLDQERDAG